MTQEALPPSKPPYSFGRAGRGVCLTCGAHITFGVSVTDPDGDELLTFCIWCVAMSLDLATGFKVFDQLWSWYERRDGWRTIMKAGYSDWKRKGRGEGSHTSR